MKGGPILKGRKRTPKPQKGVNPGQSLKRNKPNSKGVSPERSPNKEKNQVGIVKPKWSKPTPATRVPGLKLSAVRSYQGTSRSRLLLPNKEKRQKPHQKKRQKRPPKKRHKRTQKKRQK